jgi:two-component system, chemotaxis family, chemotaxis protein CheY
MATGLAVLVVDDDPQIRAFIEAALLDSSYEVRTAANGAAALALLRTWRPAVILLDLQMPIMDGWAFRRAQAVQATLIAIPVIVMSAGYNALAVAQQLGVAAGLSKPFAIEELVATVSALIT